MKTILFLTNGSVYTSRFLFPLILAENYFRDAGIRIDVALYNNRCHVEADWIVVLHDCLESAEPVIRQSALVAIRPHCDTLVWLDTSDSTGTTVFDVLPYVDLYLKKQLLRDFDLYQEPFYSLRFFSDYYHRKFGIDDEPIPARSVLDPVFAPKLRVAWNILFGDVSGDGRHHREYDFTDPRLARKYHVSFRGTQGYIPTVDFQRKLVRGILDHRSDLNKPKSEKRISIDDYLNEIRASRSIISPFGWGEVCWRDAESWLCGSALVKPDMAHLTTWPDIYHKGKTYIAMKWDLSDLDEILDGLLSNPEHFMDVAFQGQECYRAILSEAGLLSFVDHFLDIFCAKEGP